MKSAVDENRIEIYLQPMVTLPQRKVRFYEAVTRLRDDKDQLLAADDFIAVAETAGLIGRIDNMVMLKCVQVLRRLMVRNKDVGVFCNVAAATLGNPATFAQCLDFLEANRALAPSFVLEFKQATFRNLGPTETEHLAALAQRGFRFSIDHATERRLRTAHLRGAATRRGNERTDPRHLAALPARTDAGASVRQLAFGGNQGPEELGLPAEQGTWLRLGIIRGRHRRGRRLGRRTGLSHHAVLRRRAELSGAG